MNSEKYIPTIGLEIHAELKTASKMFCSCTNNPDQEHPNVHVCSICLGHPGTLPVLNKEAILHVLKIGTAVSGTLADFTEWDRKNYFYPDIPKGYQISQYAYPLVSGGTLSNIALERIHLEEDTAQSTHDSHDNSLVNFNRAGVPLMELVTTPTIHDATTAVTFARELQLLLRYVGAGDANMEKGEMRVEANISVSPVGSDKLGTKTEVKNLNSFRAVERAIAYEIERQIELLERGDTVIQETRGWDDAKNETYPQRAKEGSHDYRYFPEPDIPKLKLSNISEFAKDVLAKELPELPWIKRDRYKNVFGITDKEVAVFIDSPALAGYFESIADKLHHDPKKVRLTVNYLLTDYLKIIKDYLDSSVSRPDDARSAYINEVLQTIQTPVFAELISMVADGDLSSRGAKDILALLFKEKGSSPRALADTHGLIQKSDPSTLIPIIEKVISDNASIVAECRAGKTASLQFLIGQAMKASKGAGNPEMVKKLLVEKLG
jgi:aspartyl-tRNA(Asn)/glutamyl-tRNA(Gln) amidotransferase subunit B